MRYEDAVALAQEIRPQIEERAAAADKAGKLPPEDAALLKKSGFTALNLPKSLGGYGLGLGACVAAQLELAKASTSTALVAGMNMHALGHESDVRSWPEAIYERLAAEAVSNGILINNAASEPKLGSPSRGGSFQSYADRDEGAGVWHINGHKNWITGGRHLTHIFVKLSTDDGNATLLVEADREGVRWDETWGDALSLRASDSHDLYLEDVTVPLDNLSGAPDYSAPSNIWFGPVMAATYLGGALGARDAIIRYALERVPTALGRSIATLPKVQRQIGEIDVALQAAKTFLLDVSSRWPGGDNPALRKKLMPQIAAAKLFATRVANEVTDKALQIAGGASISSDLPLERFFRDVRAGAMHPPSGDGAYEMIGRTATEALQNE